MPEKYDQDARPDEKLLKLFMLLLFNDKEFSLSYLAETINCSKQTVARLLRRIDENYPCHLLERKSSRQKFYHLQRPSMSFKTAIDPAGLRQLALCRDLVKGLLPKEDWELVNMSLQQAKTNLPRADYSNYQDANVGTRLTRGHIDYQSKQRQLAEIEKCILNKKCCILSYQKELNGEIKNYAYAPQMLLTFHDSLYVIGWIVPEIGPVRIIKERPAKFSVHRITEVTIQNRSSAELPIKELEENSDFGFLRDEPFKAKIWFSKEVMTYISDRIWSDDQKITPQEDGGIILEMTALSRSELISFVLSFDFKAKLLEPLDLAEEIKARLLKTMDKY